jgi:ubiquinone/menaquinone biosynthesis C-methylase UbiE
MTRQEPRYVLGHSAAELERLTRQAAIFAPITRDLLVRAGIAPGQHVLDVGCGAGDVTLLAAELVGPSGRVLAVDRAAPAVETARRRTAEAGLDHVEVRHTTLDALDVASPVDGAVGRFVLMHQAEPARTLARAASFVRSGGRVAMLESHLDAFGDNWPSWPISSTYGAILERIRRAIHAAGGRTETGLRLRSIFLEAGLPEPELRAHAVLAGEDVPALCRYWGDSLRSMADAAGPSGAEYLDAAAIDALEAQMLAELDVPGAVMVAPLVVSAWSVVP